MKHVRVDHSAGPQEVPPRGAPGARFCPQEVPAEYQQPNTSKIAQAVFVSR